MKEITNRSPVVVTPKGPFGRWAKTYSEGVDEDLEQRLKEIHVYLIEWTYNEKKTRTLL